MIVFAYLVFRTVAVHRHEMSPEIQTLPKNVSRCNLKSILFFTGLAFLLTGGGLEAQDQPLEGMPELPCVIGNCQMGVGVAESPDGSKRYEGEWKAGIPHGYGRLFQFDNEGVGGSRASKGRLVEGVFSLGELKGPPLVFSIGGDDTQENYLEIRPGTAPLRAEAKALYLLIRARALLPGEKQHIFHLPMAKVEHEWAMTLLRESLRGRMKDLVERAEVHLKISTLHARLAEQGGADLVARNREMLRCIQIELSENLAAHPNRTDHCFPS